LASPDRIIAIDELRQMPQEAFGGQAFGGDSFGGQTFGLPQQLPLLRMPAASQAYPSSRRYTGQRRHRSKPKRSGQYPPAIEPLGPASFFKNAENVVERIERAEKDVLFTPGEADLMQRYRKIHSELKDLSQFSPLSSAVPFDDQFKQLQEACTLFLAEGPADASAQTLTQLLVPQRMRQAASSALFDLGYLPMAWFGKDHFWSFAETKDMNLDEIFPLCNELRLLASLIERIIGAIRLLGVPTPNPDSLGGFADEPKLRTSLKTIVEYAPKSVVGMNDQQKLDNYKIPLTDLWRSLASAFRLRYKQHEKTRNVWKVKLREEQCLAKPDCPVETFEAFLYSLFGCFGQVLTINEANDEIIISNENGFQKQEQLQLLRRMNRILDPNANPTRPAHPGVMVRDIFAQLQKAVATCGRDLKKTGGGIMVTWNAIKNDVAIAEHIKTTFACFRKGEIEFEGCVGKVVSLPQNQRASIYLVVFVWTGLEILGTPNSLLQSGFNVGKGMLERLVSILPLGV